MTSMLRVLEDNSAVSIGLTVFSIACFVGSLIALPVIVARAPTDYFIREQDPKGSILAKILRNVAGVFLLIAGVLMLLLPGQGLLAILLALTLLDFPGKQALLKRMVSRQKVAKALQWLRRRADKPPFELPAPRAA